MTNEATDYCAKFQELRCRFQRLAAVLGRANADVVDDARAGVDAEIDTIDHAETDTDALAVPDDDHAAGHTDANDLTDTDEHADGEVEATILADTETNAHGEPGAESETGADVDADHGHPRRHDLWKPPDTHAALLHRGARAEHWKQYRALTCEAGELVLQAYREGRLNLEGLAELVAGHDLGEWNGLVSDAGNLFALLTGGPYIHLVDANGHVGAYEKPGPGWPVQIRPATHKTLRAQVSLQLGDPLVDDEQCLTYARRCRSLAEAVAPPKEASTAAKRAHRQYLHAAASLDTDRPTDDEAYNLLKGVYQKDPGVKARLGRLAKPDSWKRYLRQYRKAHDEQKHRIRSGREAASRSIVRAEEV